MRQLKILPQITNRESQSLERYFQEINKVNMISAEEEVMLAKRIKEGDQMALEKLTKANLRFVVSVAKQYQNNYMTLGDLISEGNVGLIKAATRFDETRGFKFISYAVWWIRQCIMQALAENSRIVRLPLNRVSSISKISKAFAELEQKFEREPTNEELAEILEMTSDEIASSQRTSGRQISIDAPFGSENDQGLLDLLENTEMSTPDSDLLRNSLSKDIDRALSTLTSREADVISLYYGLNGKAPMSLEMVGERFSLTRERVRQIKEKAIRRLRQGMRSSVLKSHLD